MGSVNLGLFTNGRGGGGVRAYRDGSQLASSQWKISLGRKARMIKRRLSLSSTVTIAIVTILAGSSSLALAAKPDQAADLAKHLEFAGYTVETTDERLVAKHEERSSLALYKLRNGVLMQAYFISTDKVEADRAACLEMTNRANTRSTAAHSYFDKQGDLVLEAWYQPPYDRKRFAQFLDHFDEARRTLVEEDETTECLN